MQRAALTLFWDKLTLAPLGPSLVRAESLVGAEEERLHGGSASIEQGPEDRAHYALAAPV